MEDNQRIYTYCIDEAGKEIYFPRPHGMYDGQRRDKHFARFFGDKYRLAILHPTSWEHWSKKLGIKKISILQLKGEQDESRTEKSPSQIK